MVHREPTGVQRHDAANVKAHETGGAQIPTAQVQGAALHGVGTVLHEGTGATGPQCAGPHHGAAGVGVGAGKGQCVRASALLHQHPKARDRTGKVTLGNAQDARPAAARQHATGAMQVGDGRGVAVEIQCRARIHGGPGNVLREKRQRAGAAVSLVEQGAARHPQGATGQTDAGGIARDRHDARLRRAAHDELNARAEEEV
ncbi:hypothetical protein D3C86_678380 [compost metagenome]